MTRETKVGAVVAISFLSLVGVVVVSRLRGTGDPDTQAVAPAAEGKGQGTDPTKIQAPGAGGIAKATFETDDPKAIPNQLPTPLEGSQHPPAPMPMALAPLTIPNFPSAGEDDILKKLGAQIAGDRQTDPIALPPVPPPPSPPKNDDILDTPDASAAAKSAAAKRAAGQARTRIDDFLPGFSGPTNPSAAKALPPLPALPPNPSDPRLGAPPRIDVGLPPAPISVAQGDKQPRTTEPLPLFPPVPPAPLTNNSPAPTFPNNPMPVPLFGNPPNNPMPLPTADVPRPLIPMSELRVGGPPAPMPPIPAPAKTDAREVTTFEARGGETLANLSRAAYTSEKYAKALFAYNRDFAPGSAPLSMTLQAGQKLFVPPVQVLQERYAAVIDEPAPIPISINPPVPARPTIPMSQPASADPTKSYRVPAQGQFIYEIAIRTLSDGNRWGEIYRLNPNVDPRQPVPGGTMLRLPASARVQ